MRDNVGMRDDIVIIPPAHAHLVTAGRDLLTREGSAELLVVSRYRLRCCSKNCLNFQLARSNLCKFPGAKSFPFQSRGSPSQGELRTEILTSLELPM
eukprot:jgi/Botrbrau1/4471/Bobra.0220s0005.1